MSGVLLPFVAGCSRPTPASAPGKPPRDVASQCRARAGNGASPTDDSLWGPDKRRSRETRAVNEPPPSGFPDPAAVAGRVGSSQLTFCGPSALIDRIALPKAVLGGKARLSFTPGSYAEYTSYDGKMESLALVGGSLTVELGGGIAPIRGIGDLEVNPDGVVVVHGHDLDAQCYLEAHVMVTGDTAELVLAAQDPERGALRSEWRSVCRSERR